MMRWPFHKIFQEREPWKRNEFKIVLYEYTRIAEPKIIQINT